MLADFQRNTLNSLGLATICFQISEAELIYSVRPEVIEDVPCMQSNIKRMHYKRDEAVCQHDETNSYVEVWSLFLLKSSSEL